LRRYLQDVRSKRVQDVTATDVARLLRRMRDTYSSWTCVHAYKVLCGVFGLAQRRRIVTRDPMKGSPRTSAPSR
jgi:hypothetical protein